MKKVFRNALTLSLMGLITCGEFAVHATGTDAAPDVPRHPAISRKTTQVAFGSTRSTRRRSSRRSSAVSKSAAKKEVLAVSDNTVTGVAVVPDETGVRLLIEGTKAFTPEVVTMKSGSTPATIVRVPGSLSDERGIGSVAVHKHGVYTVRYANQANGVVQFVANTQSELVATATPNADKTQWEVVFKRPTAAPTQVAMVTGTGKIAPVLAPVAFHAAAPKDTPSAKPAEVKLPVAPAKPVVASPKPVLLSPSNGLAPTAAATVVRQTATNPQEDKRVSLDVVAADINDVIKALALQSGINIVTSTEVKGTITVSLKRVPMIEALDTITRLSGYQYARLNSGFIVGSPESVRALTNAGRNEQMVTEYIRYRYLSTGDLYTTLRAKFPGIQLPETGGGDANPALPKLLVLTDTPERISQVREFVAQLDKAVAEPSDTQTTEIYKIKAANATDLIRLVQQLAPTVIIQVGPSQAFQASGTGQSTSLAAGSSYGPPLGGDNSAAGGSGSATPTSGPANTQTGGITSPNTLILTGTPSNIAKARAILERIDVRTPQIAYEARVVDVNAEDLRQIGLRYDLGRQVTVGEPNSVVQGQVGPTTGPQPAGNMNFGAILRSPYSIGVTLDALENNNKARTLASPNLSAVDGQPATAFIGDQVKYVIAVQQTQQGQTIQTETATVGITLKVTGKASPDGYVTLYIHPEVSSITSYLTVGSSGISLPQISTRFVDTTVRVKNGETIAIGGLLREQDVLNLQKIPYLGDLPVLGKLFRRTEKRKTRSEIVVFVTARATDYAE